MTDTATDPAPHAPRRSRPHAAWGGALLALAALLLPLLVRPGPEGLRAVSGRATLLGLAVPGLLQAGDARLLPSDATLLAPDVQPAFRGHTVLLLALFALLAAPGRAALLWRLLATALLATFLLHDGLRASLHPLLGPTLALGAGVGLAALDTRAPAGRGGPGEMLFGMGLLAFAAPLALLAIRFGATPPAEWLPPLLPAGSAPTQAEFQRLATELQAALDFAALSAFAAMTVLLLHLKSRRLATRLLVIGWTVFELTAWPDLAATWGVPG